MEHKRSVNWFWAVLAHEHGTDQDRQATGTQASKHVLPLCTTLPSASSFGTSMQAGHTTQLNYHWHNQEHTTICASRKPKTLLIVTCTYRRHTGTSRATRSHHSAQRILAQHWTGRKIRPTGKKGQKSYRIYIFYNIYIILQLWLPAVSPCHVPKPASTAHHYTLHFKATQAIFNPSHIQILALK